MGERDPLAQTPSPEKPAGGSEKVQPQKAAAKASPLQTEL